LQDLAEVFFSEIFYVFSCFFEKVNCNNDENGQPDGEDIRNYIEDIRNLRN